MKFFGDPPPRIQTADVPPERLAGTEGERKRWLEMLAAWVAEGGGFRHLAGDLRTLHLPQFFQLFGEPGMDADDLRLAHQRFQVDQFDRSRVALEERPATRPALKGRQEPMFRPFRASKPTTSVPRATSMLAKLAWPLPWADMFRPVGASRILTPPFGISVTEH